MMFSPVLLSRDAMKSVPAGKGRNVRAIPVSTKEGSDNGMFKAEELIGKISNEAGICPSVRFEPEKEIVTWSHC